MHIVVNGDATDINGAVTVTEALAILKVKMPDIVSVELNGEILERKSFETTVLKDGARVEFLYFMGGGGEIKRIATK